MTTHTNEQSQKYRKIIEDDMFEKQIASAQENLKQLIAIPSLSRNESQAADRVEAIIVENGFTPQRHGNNVWCIAPDFAAEKPTLLLNSHIDTVKPVDGWNSDPFTPVETEESITGLGANDAGASLVCLFETFLILSRTPQSYNLIFLASCEEEVSGAGGVESVLPLLPPISCGIVGEPTGMRMAVAEKGLIVFDCYVKGVAGHAAHGGGDNAIYKSLEVIDQVKNFLFPRVSHLLGEVRKTVTMIQAGTQHNVIPDLCSFVIDVRSNELYTNQEIFDMLRKYLPCEVKPRSLRLNSSFIDSKHPIVLRAKKMEMELFGSPTLSDQSLMPFPTVKMGPGDTTRSHTANEYILKKEIKGAIPKYVALLDGLQLNS